MKVKDKYYSRGGFEVTTLRLIERGTTERSGQFEDLEAKVSQLMDVVAALIDRSGLSDAEILKITGCDSHYDICNDG